LPCCNQKGFLRKSGKGLKHFAHFKSSNTCNWKPESPEHLKAKIDIIEACKENGWKAIPEFSEADWRADVLAIQNQKRIAFEVQWSRQSYGATIFRQDRYAESNVRGCWFFRIPPKELMEFGGSLAADKELPAFKIFKDEHSNLIAQLKQKQLPLKALVSSLLRRKLKFCEQISPKPDQEIVIMFFEICCWKCKKPQYCFTVDHNILSVCNQRIIFEDSLWDSDEIDKNSFIYEAVKQFLQSEKGKNIKVGQVKKRFSKTLNKSYLSHGCFYCDAIFGDFFLNDEKQEGKLDPKSIRHKLEIDMGTIKVDQKHWCYSENGKFCE